MADDRGSNEARPRSNPLHQIEIDDFRRDRLLAALALIFGASFCLGLPFALQAGAEFFLPLTAAIVIAIALVPLCPHALTNRPILVGDRNEIEIRIVYATDSRAHFDGQVTVDLRNDDCVRIRRSEYSICLLHPPAYSYFAMLRQKLRWSERPKEH